MTDCSSNNAHGDAIKRGRARFLNMEFAAPKNIQQPNNFNALRLILALYVFLCHFVDLSAIDTPLLFLDGPDAVRGFFVISGFLIYSSYCRSSSLKSYFIKRGRRIFPSYFFIVIFFSVALFFVSSLTLSEYFGKDWLRYLLSNMAFSNFMQPTLPGVFEGNHIDVVNGSLWTIKIELMCYIALPLLLFLCRKSRINPFLFFGGVIVLSIVYSFVCDMLLRSTGDIRYAVYARQIAGQLAYFVMGMMLYELLHLVIMHRYKLLVAGVALLALAYMVPAAGSAIKPFAISFIVLPAAFIGRWGFWLGSTDISYDFYLLHFPVLQLFVHFKVAESTGVVPALFIALATVTVLSLASWHLVGKRFLVRRRQAEVGNAVR